jgi:DNA-binding transcriptional MerR regulator
MKSKRYSITDLERLTGVKAPTIRMWEKRYGIISPERTDSNIRFYSVNDLQRLLNIVFLNRHGFKISVISEMTEEDIGREVLKLTENPEGDEGMLPAMIKAALELDEETFERLLNASILKSGFEKSFNHLVFPLLEKIRLLWQINKVSACQERFVKNLIRHKLVVAIDGLGGHSNPNPNHYLLFLPNGQFDEITLLYANYLLRKNGHHVVYLGPSIPLDHLRSIKTIHVMDAIVVHTESGFSHKELSEYIDSLLHLFPNQQVLMLVPTPGQEPLKRNGRLKVIPMQALSDSLLPT